MYQVGDNMKIQVNYDLLEEIVCSKKGVSINRIVKHRIAAAGLAVAICSLIDICIGKFPEALPNNITSIGVLSLGFYVGDIVVNNIPRINEENKFDAYDNLKRLSTNLQVLQVKTNSTLLQDGILLEKHHKIVKSKKGFPLILEQKYIEIPTCSDYGYNSSETLLQEHIIGSNNYDISVEEPPKQKRLQFAKGSI